MFDGTISRNWREITGKITSIPETRENIINGYESLKEISDRYATECEGPSSKQFLQKIIQNGQRTMRRQLRLYIKMLWMRALRRH